VLYLAVLILGSIPGARSEVAQVASGLVLHFVTYSCIALLLFTGFEGRLSARALITVLVIAGMGALDEYVQSFFPYRNAALRDWFVDAAAGLLMSGLLCAALPKKRRSVSVK
jgi:VanZ family protein